MEATRFRVFVIAVAAVAAASKAAADSQAAGKAPQIVETPWLAERLGSGNLVVVDVGRSPQNYAAGHIPGAVYLEQKAIYDTVNGVEGMFPGVERAVEALRRIGVGNDSTVVLYDSANSLWAARGFWALEYLGHEDVHVLNGGLARWRDEGRPLSRETPAPARAAFVAHVVPSRLADKATVLACSADPGARILDARTRAEYAGTDVRAKRGGHIPGAVNIDWQLAATDDESKLFLAEEELAELYTSAGITRDKTVVAHCQTGVRAAHTYLVLRSLGYTDVAVYDGSWVEWGNDDTTPVVKGE
jgi:thiosulfate/3-mercaptopyruvate sulfurtransferase